MPNQLAPMPKPKTVIYVTNSQVVDKYTIPSIIELEGDSVTIVDSKNSFDLKFRDLSPDLVICDRANFLLSEEQINQVEGLCFNIHPSFLPYNRGYHPNFWSHYDNTPSGVTLHAINKGIDSGLIIARTEVCFDDDETLRTTYEHLRAVGVYLFKAFYPKIRKITHLNMLLPNSVDKGTIHYKKDFETMWPALEKGWDTPIAKVRRLKSNLEVK